MIRIISALERKPMPWKNGFGTTEEIVIFPPYSSVEDFNWRISMAYVTADNVFSSFTGVTRHMVLLEGEMSLTFPEHTVYMSPDHNPLRFSGDTIVSANVISGPVRDLNIMTRNQYCAADVTRMQINEKICFQGAEHILFALQDQTVQAENRTYNIKRYDAIYVDSYSKHEKLHCSGSCWLSTITKR